MTLREKLDKLKLSEIYKLKYDGKVVGLRVKVYNVSSDNYDYYDFSLSIIENESIKKFINSIESGLNSINLVQSGDLLITKEELNGSISVMEFKSEREAVSVLNAVVYVYECRKVGA